MIRASHPELSEIPHTMWRKLAYVWQNPEIKEISQIVYVQATFIIGGIILGIYMGRTFFYLDTYFRFKQYRDRLENRLHSLSTKSNGQ